MLHPVLTRPLDVLRGLGGTLLAVAIFSVVVNALMLAGPLYMLQVYDRVLTSQSEETLLTLTLLIAALYIVMAALDQARTRIAARVGAQLQTRLENRVLRDCVGGATIGRQSPAGLRDVDALHRVAGSPVLFALIDLPWAPVFVLAITAFHPLLGLLALVGAGILVLLAVLNQLTTRRREAEVGAVAAAADTLAETMRREAETVRSLAMEDAMLGRWRALRARARSVGLASGDCTGFFANASKALRYFLQSAILGLGAWLAIRGELTPGTMVAASILFGRAMAPVEQAIAGWPSVLAARRSWSTLARHFTELPAAPAPLELPRPEARLELNEVTAFPPDGQRATLRMLSFTVAPGEALGVIGASASGKSSLARLLTGLWAPAGGSVRLGGASLDQFTPEALGRHVGYLPQDVVLFDGTIAENIARMATDPDPQGVVSAALRAGAHEMILSLPSGYATPVGSRSGLSGGQRQRIGLARAFYGEPVLLVLDEPDAALDGVGAAALAGAVRQAKAEGRAVVIMAHRPSAIAECDRLLVLEDGIARAIGPRDQVLRTLTRDVARVPAAGEN